MDAAGLRTWEGHIIGEARKWAFRWFKHCVGDDFAAEITVHQLSAEAGQSLWGYRGMQQ